MRLSSARINPCPSLKRARCIPTLKPLLAFEFQSAEGSGSHPAASKPTSAGDPDGTSHAWTMHLGVHSPGQIPAGFGSQAGYNPRRASEHMFKLDQQLFPNTFSRVSSFNAIPVREDILFAQRKGRRESWATESSAKAAESIGSST